MAEKNTKLENMKFEDALKELSEIVTKLEEGDLPLDGSLEAFERGIGLVKTCEKRLTEAEQKVNILVNGEEKPFDGK